MMYDLSPPISNTLPVWPGDTPPARRMILDMKKGDNLTLSALETTVHLGSHADGPNHYGKDASGVGELALEYFLGPCDVIEAKVSRGERVLPGQLVGGVESIVTTRVLIKTGTFPDPQNWNNDFAGLSPELIDALADRGVRTVGVDAPSVDLFSDKAMIAHQAILRRGLVILEGLMLGPVPPGRYELIALPLKLMGFDGSPVRAILRGLDV